MLRTFKYRLYPSKTQEYYLLLNLEITRNWYNMCLSERKLAWDYEQRNVSCYDQMRTGISYRKMLSGGKYVSSQTMQNVCKDLDKSFKAYFRRVKEYKKIKDEEAKARLVLPPCVGSIASPP